LLERWRKPAQVITVEEQDAEGIWLPDGRVQGGVRMVVAPETAERMRLGYLCMKCLEPFETPWPERCGVCGAPVREKQAEFFAEEFAGARAGRDFSVEEEIERMREEPEGR
jgi:hypothetical protein